MVNPYTDLKQRARTWARSVLQPKDRLMFRYAKKDLSAGWDLRDLYERTIAARQLGYRVEVRSSDDGLSVH